MAGASTLTGTGVLMGTLAYMSPEQAIGQSVGPPSDVFSLASVLVFAATGRGPYGDGTQAELLYRVAHQVPSLDDVPPAGAGAGRAVHGGGTGAAADHRRPDRAPGRGQARRRLAADGDDRGDRPG